MAKIFISYRRDDSAAHAGRLYDRLEGHFGQGQVFMDVDAIEPGLDFVQVVQQAVNDCDGLVAVIGGEWLQAADAAGDRRLEDPVDLVRLEIATALERGIRVIPVLVQGAQMPQATDLPEDLKRLASRNALEISDTRFRSDVDRLIEALEAPTQERPTGGVFVGQDQEMSAVKAALADTLADLGRLVMLVGEWICRASRARTVDLPRLRESYKANRAGHEPVTSRSRAGHEPVTSRSRADQ